MHVNHARPWCTPGHPGDITFIGWPGKDLMFPPEEEVARGRFGLPCCFPAHPTSDKQKKMGG